MNNQSTRPMAYCVSEMWKLQVQVSTVMSVFSSGIREAQGRERKRKFLPALRIKSVL
jgi:hypothetical protein